MTNDVTKDSALQAVALIEQALVLLDTAGLTLAAVHLEHVLQVVSGEIGLNRPD